MIISAFYVLCLSIPVLLLGEWLNRKIKFLSKYCIPPAMIGGIVVALLAFVINITDITQIKFFNKIDAGWWTWLVTIEPEWAKRPMVNVHLPFLMIFFTGIGLNSSWALLKKGSYQVALFWVLSFSLAALQNVLAIGVAYGIGESPLMGLLCGSASCTGGHGTALGFAHEFEKYGLMGADAIGAASATFGLIVGGFLGAPIATILIKKYKLEKHPEISDSIHLESGDNTRAGILVDLHSMVDSLGSCIKHLLILLVVIKGGVWVSHYLQMLGVTFPIYIGSMIVAVCVRNILEFFGLDWINSETVDLIGSVALNIFLAVALLSIDLVDLLGSAVPMFIILTCQAIMAGLFAYNITIRVMGKDYEAAVMTAGFYGFTLGAVPNALANMRIIADKYGPAPRAFLVIPIVGAFLIDFTNALNITFFMNLIK